MRQNAGDPDNVQLPGTFAERAGHHRVREHQLPRYRAQGIHRLGGSACPVQDLSGDPAAEAAGRKAVHLFEHAVFRSRDKHCAPVFSPGIPVPVFRRTCLAGSVLPEKIFLRQGILCLRADHEYSAGIGAAVADNAAIVIYLHRSRGEIRQLRSLGIRSDHVPDAAACRVKSI